MARVQPPPYSLFIVVRVQPLGLFGSVRSNAPYKTYIIISCPLCQHLFYFFVRGFRTPFGVSRPADKTNNTIACPQCQHPFKRKLIKNIINCLYNSKVLSFFFVYNRRKSFKKHQSKQALTLVNTRLQAY